MEKTLERAIELIKAERLRQIEKEGFTQEHDAEHEDNILAQAAASYALDEEVRNAISELCTPELFSITNVPVTWPFDDEYWKPSPDNRLRELIKAAALIIAEIERLLNKNENTTR